VTPEVKLWARLLHYIDRSGECWVWTASTSLSGYGRISFVLPDGRRKLLQAHRVMYELVHGPIPAEMVVRHSCDNPPCCRPDHLLLGSQAENVQDMVDRGRHGHGMTIGEDHVLAKLTVGAVVELRRDRVAGATLAVLAARYGIGKTQVARICRGESWSHVPMPEVVSL
jgi:hypothetical protein